MCIQEWSTLSDLVYRSYLIKIKNREQAGDQYVVVDIDLLN